MNAAMLWVLLPLLPLGLAEADQATTAGRKALDHWWGYPWYDAASDGVRRVEITPPRNPPRPDTAANPGLPDVLVQWAAWIGIALLLGGLVYVLLQAYLRRRLGSPSGDATDAAETDQTRQIESLASAVRGGRQDLLAEARRHYQQGNYGQAVVYLFSFQLVQLDKRQILRLSKGKTNRQYLRELGSRSALRQLLEQTMSAFEDVFFGHHPLDRERFEACWSRLEEFEALAAEAA